MPVLLLLLTLVSPSSQTTVAEHSPVGSWQTVSDVAGQPQSVVTIYEERGLLFARVERVLVTDGVPLTCIQCRDDRKDKPLGLVIMRNMRNDGSEYKGGDILDPESGKVYKCRLTLDASGQTLTVRGYVGTSLFGRSQVWKRVPGSVAQTTF